MDVAPFLAMLSRLASLAAEAGEPAGFDQVQFQVLPDPKPSGTRLDRVRIFYAVDEDRFNKTPAELAEIDALNASLQATAPDDAKAKTDDRAQQLADLARQLGDNPEGGFL